MQRKIIGEVFSGERALFMSSNLELENCLFKEGESPLKHAKDIELEKCVFEYKYPLWYAENIKAQNTLFLENARSGLWYSNNLSLKECSFDAPKCFRKSKQIKIYKAHFANALESFWNCEDIELFDVSAKGDYFAMNALNLRAENLEIYGNYCFDGAKNLHIKKAKLISKDAFWNCENVIVEDSFIVGEYLGWNSKNLSFKNCVISSLQGLCYVENLSLEECKFIDTSLAFEYSSVKGTIISSIKSIINPNSAKIKVLKVEELILDESKISLDKISIEEGL
ncbi:DUF3737 domain-containing protein [Campylobacter sp. MIT 99-7217]|uniref:DUF3737 family protein n=1 Tax=Campylobacter sp. MIT 99-7217 TaxID=535091 RepID=UPI001158B848|nr:DUF3737 family protein [Campylobacter sp. MIT 99-7217]TQR29536.1 DUF3737 domain-containing protein [Campylobacter sp. MIT 99-7217]